MKKIVALLTFSVLLIACGKGDALDKKSTEDVIKTKNLTEIKAKRALVHTQYEKYAKELKALDAAIAEQDTTKKNPLVSLYMIKDTVFKHHIEIQGSVNTKENIMVHPQFSGAIVTLNVKAGQKVVKGQILATIEDGGLRSQLAQLEIQVNLAKTTYERQSRLWNQKIGSEIQYLQAKTNLESQQKAVAQLRTQLEKTNIKAPFTGVADEVLIELGQVVSPGMAVMRIVNLSDMFVSAIVPENYLGKLKVGTAVDVFVQTTGKNYLGKVRQVGNFINPNNRSFSIEVFIPNTDNLLRPNQVAVLKIEDYTNPKAITVPENILQENGMGEKVVYIATIPVNGKETATVKKQIVTVGQTANAIVEIKSGLKSGDKIVNEGVKSMRDGLEVEIVK